MKIVFEDKCGEKLADLLCEIDALIEDGTISVGFTGLSPDITKFCKLFYRGTNERKNTTDVYFTDAGLHLN